MSTNQQIDKQIYEMILSEVVNSLSNNLSNYEMVKEFTEEAYEIKCPTVPVPMNKDTVTFLIKMMLSEITELAETVTTSPEDALDLVKSCIGADVHTESTYSEDPQETAANQADALVDCYYYSLNVACKHGLDLSKVFNSVHEANMNKRDPDTGKFIRRESDGKVLKPSGWKASDIKEVLFPRKIEITDDVIQTMQNLGASIWEK